MMQAATLPKRPTTAEELGAMVRAVGEAGGQVRIAGSDSMPLAQMDVGRAVQTVSMLRMNKLVEHAVGDMTVIVQAGMSLEALQRELAWRDQWLPVDPPAIGDRLPGQRTIGGMIATNSLGPLRFGCGDWRLFIMGMRWIDANGTVIKGGGRTVKNVAGYNTPRMMIGSFGSLGAIAEITLRTFARPKDEQCVIFFCGNAKQAEELIAAVFVSATTPSYIQIVGGRTFSTNPLELPTMKGGVAVVIGFFDRAEVCAAQIETLRQLPEAKGLESISQTAAQSGRLRLWMTTEPAVQDRGVGFRIHALSSQVCEILAQLEAIASTEGAKSWLVSEAGTGVVRGLIHGPSARNNLSEVCKRFPGAQVLITQGSSAQSSPPPDLFIRIKRELDPQSIFGLPPS